MPEKPKAFLTAIKEQADGFFADAYDQLEAGEPAADVLKTARKRIWELMETKLKESYRNGQLAKGNGHTRSAAAADPEAPANPFRK